MHSRKSHVEAFMSRPLAAVALLVAVGGVLLMTLGQAEEPKSATSAAPRGRLLPGVQPSGQVLLPNQWSLRPAGRHVRLGDFPVNLAIHPSGRWLAALHAGYDD